MTTWHFYFNSTLISKIRLKFFRISWKVKILFNNFLYALSVSHLTDPIDRSDKKRLCCFDPPEWHECFSRAWPSKLCFEFPWLLSLMFSRSRQAYDVIRGSELVNLLVNELALASSSNLRSRLEISVPFSWNEKRCKTGSTSFWTKTSKRPGSVLPICLTFSRQAFF